MVVLVSRDAQVHDLEAPASDCGHDGRSVAVADLAASELTRSVVRDDLVAGAEDADDGLLVDGHFGFPDRGEQAQFASYSGDLFAFP